MAKTETRPKVEGPPETEGHEETTVNPRAHDAPGLSPFERMTELTRRIVNVPPKELAREKAKNEKRREHPK